MGRVYEEEVIFSSNIISRIDHIWYGEQMYYLEQELSLGNNRRRKIFSLILVNNFYFSNVQEMSDSCFETELLIYSCQVHSVYLRFIVIHGAFTLI